jgi:hypothetical protein
MSVNEFFKTPTDVLDYTFDWSSWLPAGDSISSVTWTVASGLIQEGSPAPSNTTSTATVWLGGGSGDQTYVVTCDVVTTAGRNATWFTTIVVQTLPTEPSAPRVVLIPGNGE